MKTISANLNIMIKASDKASKILIRDFGEIEKLQVSKKGPKDFVTNSDLKTEKILIEELKKARPHYSILSEENGYNENKDLKNTWIIDPIDGTNNFITKYPYFCISIAGYINNEIISGCILNPLTNELFLTVKGHGAYLNNKKYKVSDESKFSNLIYGTGFVISAPKSVKKNMKNLTQF